MKRTAAALLASALLLGPTLSQAESLREIYELALENDAQLKAEQAQYLARRETENLTQGSPAPQLGTAYSYTERDADNKSQSRDFSEPGFPIF